MEHILIAEDDVNIASDLKSRFEAESYVVDVVYDGLLAERLITRGNYDCIILDINMPGKNGIEVCKAIRAQNIHAPVLMLTAFGEVDDKLLGFESGADDYLTKPFYFKELMARVKSLLKRSQIAGKPEEISTIHDLIIDYKAKRVTRAGVQVKLTPREFEILSVLAAAKGEIVSKKELIRLIWSTQVEVNTNTIEVFINSIRNKVDKNFPVKLIHTRPGFGYYISPLAHEA